MRTPIAGLVSLLVLLAIPAAAHADAQVSYANGNLDVSRVLVNSGTQPPVRAIIEPFRDCCRDGFRVAQAASGDPALRSNDSDCFENGAANDVVCNGPRTSVSVLTGTGADEIFFVERFHDGGDCREVTPAGFHTATVSLGDGNDKLSVAPSSVTPCAPGQGSVGFFVNLDAHGNAGNDTMTGLSGADRLDGGGDTDTLDGGVGNDTLLDSAGDDTANGGAGDDVFLSGSGKDKLRGGDGVDTVDYSARGTHVFIGLGSTGGGDGDNDDIGNDIENATGGIADDILSGNAVANTLRGNQNNDNLFGHEGNDVLEGGTGNDVLTPGPGSDRATAGDGDDRVFARDAEPDTLNCGLGADRVDVDLVDGAASGLVKGGCETVDRAAVDDGPGAHAVGRRFSLDTHKVTVLCPYKAKVRCDGKLTLRAASGGIVGRGRYSAGVGERDTIAVTLIRKLRKGQRLSAQTLEPGASVKGPRSTARPLRARS